ncbi:hypothetical protein [Vibrio lentus]|nr:hypothetical protein [Vibrio lentus]
MCLRSRNRIQPVIAIQLVNHFMGGSIVDSNVFFLEGFGEI